MSIGRSFARALASLVAADRRSRRSSALIFTVALTLSLVVPAITPGRSSGDPQPIFPAEHDEFLGGASYAWLFGQDFEATEAGPSSPTGLGRPPRVGPNVRVNDPQVAFPNGLLGRSETTVSSTDDGQLIVAGWNDAEGFLRPPFFMPSAARPTPLPGTPGLSGFGFSTDGGVTWVDGGAPTVFSNVVTRGDPWLDRGGFDGLTFYYANLAVHLTTGGTLGVSVHRGRFVGGTLVWQDVRIFNAPNPKDFYDKEAIAAAKDGSGTAYVSLTNFIELCGQPAFGFGQIELWRTADGGDTWQGPAIASADKTFITDPANALCGETGVLQQSSVPAIGPNGEVYVAWQLGPTFTPSLTTDAKIAVAKSLDGGVTFGPTVTVATINSMRQNTPVGYNRTRINDHPRIAVATTGPNRGRVYVAYASARTPVAASSTTQSLVSSNVFLRYSDDGGQTWSAEVLLAPAPPASGVKRFWPVVNVEPGGNVDVVYYESQERQATANPTDIECNVLIAGRTTRRRGTVSSLVDTFWAPSVDGGATFESALRLTTATSNWCTAASNIRPNFGDYIGAASGGNRVIGSWADGRNGVPDVFHAAGLGAGKSQ